MHARCLITPQGPLLQVSILVSMAKQSALGAAGQQPPPPVMANLLVDTGASCTSIDLGAVTSLALTPTGSVPVHTPSTGAQPVMQQVYDVALAIFGRAPQGPGPGVHLVPNLPVLAAAFAAQGIDGLLGRDVLSQCRMHYAGVDGELFLSF